MPIIEIKDLNFSYNADPAILNVSLSVEKGDYIGLAGPNGAGKTTLIRLLLGIENPDKGSIMIEGQSNQETGSRLVGYMPQRLNSWNPLFPITAAEALDLAADRHCQAAQRKQRVEEAISLLGLEKLRSRRLDSLSGGQLQKVFLARALMNKPQILILDEPGSALDPKAREQFFDLLGKINREQGITIILVTHDIAQIGNYANKLLYLDKKVVFYGSFPDFCHSQEMLDYFGPYSQHLICHQHSH